VDYHSGIEQPLRNFATPSIVVLCTEI
jgi:hypothetical protein